MATNRASSLTPWAVRSHRKGALAIGLGLGFMTAITGPAYLAGAKAIAGGLKALAAQAQPIAQSVQFLTGPVSRLDTIGGYLSYKVFGSMTLVVAIYAALQGTQVLRGSEVKGLLDLWLSAARTRTQIFRDRVLAFLIAFVLIVLSIYVSTGLSGAMTGEQLWTSAVGQCIGVAAVGLVAFSLALLLSQFTQSTRAASGVTSAYLVAAYFVANISDSLGWASFLRFLSPFNYYIQLRTLVPGTTFDVGALAVLVGASGVLAGLAWRTFLHRDSGGIVLARIRRTRAADYRFRPSRFWRRWLWTDWIWEQRIAMGSWFVAIFTLMTIEAAVVPTALDLVRRNSGTASLAKVASLTQSQYVSFLMAFLVVVIAGFLISQVARWVGDASQHRIDALLAQPVGLQRFVAERAIFLTMTSAMLSGAMVLGAMTGATIGGYGLDAGGLTRTFLDVVIFGFAVGGVGLVAAAIFRNGVATAVVAALVVACLFLTTISGLLNWPSWTNRPSVFDAFGSPYLTFPDIGSVSYLVALGAAGAIASYVVMKRGARIAA